MHVGDHGVCLCVHGVLRLLTAKEDVAWLTDVPHWAGWVAATPAQQTKEQDKQKHSENRDDSEHIRWEIPMALVMRPALVFIVFRFDQSFIETILVISIVDAFHRAYMIAFAEAVAFGYIVVAHRVV